MIAVCSKYMILIATIEIILAFNKVLQVIDVFLTGFQYYGVTPHAIGFNSLSCIKPRQPLSIIFKKTRSLKLVLQILVFTGSAATERSGLRLIWLADSICTSQVLAAQ